MAETIPSQSPGAVASDPTPIVERPGSGKIGLIVFAVLLVLGGVWIFSLMNTARQQAAVSPISEPTAATGRIAAAPPPELPERFATRPRAVEEATRQPRPPGSHALPRRRCRRARLAQPPPKNQQYLRLRLKRDLLLLIGHLSPCGRASAPTRPLRPPAWKAAERAASTG